MKKLNIYTVITSVLILIPFISMAQDGFGDFQGDAPVDGGLSLLIAGGVGYGVKKLKEKKKEQEARDKEQESGNK